MKFKKITIVFLISLVLILCTASCTYGVTGIYNNLTPDTGVSNIAQAILGVIRGIAGVTAAVGTIVLGIRYVYSAPGEKAEIKKKMIPFIIGAVLIFGATVLVDTVYQVAKGLF